MTISLLTLARLFFRLTDTDATTAPVSPAIPARADVNAEYARLRGIYMTNGGDGDTVAFDECWQANPASGNPEWE